MIYSKFHEIPTYIMNSDYFKLKTHLQDGFCISSLKLPFASEIVKKPVKKSLYIELSQNDDIFLHSLDRKNNILKNLAKDSP